MNTDYVPLDLSNFMTKEEIYKFLYSSIISDFERSVRGTALLLKYKKEIDAAGKWVVCSDTCKLRLQILGKYKTLFHYSIKKFLNENIHRVREKTYSLGRRVLECEATIYIFRDIRNKMKVKKILSKYIIEDVSHIIIHYI